MLKICAYYSIGTEFLDLLLALGIKPKDSDAGLGGMSVTHRPDGSYGESSICTNNNEVKNNLRLDMCYLMVYVEETPGKRKASWPVRQTVVFHRFTLSSEGNLWILIHPTSNSVLQQRLEAFVFGDSSFLEKAGCLKLHLLAFSSYLENWRWYLKALSDEFEEIVKHLQKIYISQS
jgi:hypothetical protein